MDGNKNMLGAVLSEEEARRRASAVWLYVHYRRGEPVEPESVDRLLDGLVDIHVHGAPAGRFLAGRPTVLHTALEAGRAKVKALVFKDHCTMSNNFTQIVNESLELLRREKEAQGVTLTPVRLYGGIVLNDPVGGLNPGAVDASLSYGDCVEVWLPSLSARHQMDLIAEETGMPNAGGIQVSENGEPVPALKKVLDLLADYNRNSEGKRVALGACHVSNREKFDVLRYIRKRGMDIDVIIDHCTQELTIATEEEFLEMMDLGATLEFAETSCVPWTGMQDWIINYDFSFRLLRDLIAKRGTEQLVLCSDSGQPGHEFVPGWRSFLTELLAHGIAFEDVRAMSHDVPMRLTGIR